MASVLRDLLSRVAWLRGYKIRVAPPRSKWDIEGSIPLPKGLDAHLWVECKANFSPSQFESISDRPEGSFDSRVHVRLLAMPHVSSRMASICQQHGWGWFDLAGNCHIEIPGYILLDRSGQQPVRIEKRESVNLGSAEAGWIIRALLAPENAGRRWTQRGIVGHFQSQPAPSLALVNKVVQHLRDQAMIAPAPDRGFHIVDPLAMLEQWRQDYRYSRTTRRRYFSLLHGAKLAEALMKLKSHLHGQIEYAAFSAADFQAPNVRQPRTWLYLTPELEEPFKSTTEAKEVDSGENLVVFFATDPGVFYLPDAAPQRIGCTNPVQTYIDLKNIAGRGAEAAESILEQKLKPAWLKASHAR